MKNSITKTLQKLISPLLIFTIIQTAFAQSPAPKKADETAADFKKEAVVFLRETASEVGGLRSPENRVSFAAELAGLMWFNDEKESRVMYLNVISDFRQLLGQYDAQMNTLEAASEGGSDGGGSVPWGDDSEKGKLSRKFRTAMSVRQQIATSMAEHDPQLAFDFFFDSLNAITNAGRRKEYENQDKYFEARLLTEIAESNAAKAAELGRKSLAKGDVTYAHLELLRKIYAKDADKGAEFADDIARKLKDQSGGMENINMLSSVLSTGVENFDSVKKGGGKKPMFSEQNLRDLSERLAQILLDAKPESGIDPMAYVNTIEKFAPSRAVQIRAKFGKSLTGNGTGTGVGMGTGPGPRDPSRYTVATSVPAPDYEGSGEPKLAPTEGETEADRTRAEKRKVVEQLFKDVQSLGAKQLPKEEREKIVAQARKIVSEMGSKDQKVMALSMLAAQVAKVDKELAGEILKEAGGLINPQPKNYKDFILVWMLASGYAEADPDKAFPLLEDAIFRLNDVISGVVRVAEFVDVSGEFVDDGEMQVGAFGGSMIRELTRELGIVEGTLRNLGKADLVKTKALTNRFDRAEVRVLAKMLVLRAVLGKAKNDGNSGGAIDSDTN